VVRLSARPDYEMGGRWNVSRISACRDGGDALSASPRMAPFARSVLRR